VRWRRRVLERQLKDLSVKYPLLVSDDYRYLTVQEFDLPPGFNCHRTEILVEIPPGYPRSPPGVGESHVYVNRGLLFMGRRLSDLYDRVTPDWEGEWAWLCYRQIDWDPHRDNLVTFMEMIRTDLTKPSTE
jgi:hypothetical protein